MNSDTGGVITRFLRIRDILNMRLTCVAYSRCIGVPPVRFMRSAMHLDHYLSARSADTELIVTHDFVHFETAKHNIRLKRKNKLNFYATNYALPQCILYSFGGTPHLFAAIQDLFPNMMDILPVFVYINKAPSQILKVAERSPPGATLVTNVGGNAYNICSNRPGREGGGIQLHNDAGDIICSAATGIARPGAVVIYDGGNTYVDDIDNVRRHAVSLRVANVPVLMHISDAFALYF